MFYSSLEHSADDSATLTAIESCPSDESECRIEGSEEVCVNSSSDVLPEMESVTFEEHRKMLKKMVQKDFIELQKCKRSLLTYQAMYKGAQVIVVVESTVLTYLRFLVGRKV